MLNLKMLLLQLFKLLEFRGSENENEIEQGLRALGRSLKRGVLLLESKVYQARG